MFGSLLKAVVGVVITPIALVADIVSLPATATDLRRGPFDKTAAVLKGIGRNVDKALEP